MKHLYKFSAILLLSLAVIVMACSSDDDDAPDLFPATAEAAVNTYADIVLANYEDSRNDAQTMLDAINAFVASPSEASLTTARQAWLNAQESYGQTEVFRFYGGPIDDEDGPEGQLNAWPLDESLIDYVDIASNGDDPNDNDGSNIINSPDDVPVINKDVIAGFNEVGAETNISTGYHAVEFLLWGQDTDLGAGGGNRPFTDFVTGEGGTRENQDRRADYLVAAAELIIDDLNSLIAEWGAGGAYRTFFTSAAEIDNSIERILNGMGKLSSGELAGERIAVAVDLKSVEDEHSCFSDNTHRDVVTNAKGIENVFLGAYTRTNGTVIRGTGIYDVVKTRDEELAESLRINVSNSVQLAEVIKAPFEQELFDNAGIARLEAVISSLEAQGQGLAEAASEFGFTFDPNDI
ncbi:MAG: imelysin family protein [Bacteroidota bacterium]